MEKTASIGKPSIFIQYPGPAEHDNEHDVLIYLRPESNGVLVESILLRAIERSEEYKKSFHLVYMANLPGGFICHNKVVERYYSVQLQFAALGVALFTDYMRQRFERHFNCDIDKVDIVGSFEALHLLNVKPQELFSMWVDPKQMLKLCGQTIKCIQRDNGHPLYVINYDIPALLHCNTPETNLVVMLFRTILGYAHFSAIVTSMRQELLSHDLVGKNKPLSRLMHISRGPFEEVLDAFGYLYIDDGRAVNIQELSFPCYMQRHGVAPTTIEKLISHPIAQFRNKQKLKERNIIGASRGDSYEVSRKRLETLHSCYLMPPWEDTAASLIRARSLIGAPPANDKQTS